MPSICTQPPPRSAYYVTVPWRTIIGEQAEDTLPLQCDVDRRVQRMREAFAATGGMKSLDRLLAYMDRNNGPVAADVRQWVASRRAIGFAWRGEIWLPMFQFSRFTLDVHAPMLPLLRDLSALGDAWEVANWFAQPNSWLRGRLPVDLLVRELESVRDAARLDRFVAAGDTD